MHEKTRFKVVIIAVVFLSFGLFTLCMAGEQPGAPPSPAETAPAGITAASVSKKLELIRSSESLPEDVKKQLLETYSRVQEQVALADKYRDETKTRNDNIEKLQVEVTGLKKQLESQKQPPNVEGTSTVRITAKHAATLDDTTLPGTIKILKLRLEKLESSLASETATITTTSGWLDATTSRKDALPDLIASVEKRVRELKTKTGILKRGENESPELFAARRDLAHATELAAEQELQSLKSELDESPLLTEKLTLQKSAAQKRQSELKKAIEPVKQNLVILQKESDRRLLNEKSAVAKQALQQTPVLGELAEEDRKLMLLKTGGTGGKAIRDKIRETETLLASVTGKADLYETRLANLKKKVQVVGMNNAIGLLMRQIRGTLPKRAGIRERIERRQEIIAETELRRLELRERLEKISDPEPVIAEYMDRVKETDSQKRKQIEESLRKHLQSISTTLRGDGKIEGLLPMYEEYAGKLSQLDMEQARFLQIVDSLATYIDSRILWIRSTKPVGVQTAKNALDALAWLFDPTSWVQLFRSLWTTLIERLYANILALCLVAAVFVLGVKINRGFPRRAEALSETSTRSFGREAAELILVTIEAAAWPVVLFWLAWVTGQVNDGTGLAAAISSALFHVSIFVFPACVFVVLCRENGAGRTIFQWSENTLKTGRMLMKWIAFAGGTIVFLIFSASGHPVSTAGDAIGQLSFIVAFIATGIAAGMLLHPKSRFSKTTYAQSQKGLLYKARLFWYPLVFLLPLALALISSMGYLYTVTQLGQRLVVMFWFLLGTMVMYSWIMRRFEIARRRLAEANDSEKQSTEDDGENSEERRKSLLEISRQSRAFVNYITIAVVGAGLWLIWSDVTPALGYLEKIILWSNDLADGNRVTVTLADICLALLLITLTIAAGKNFPSLLEMTLLRKFGLDTGAGYAISALARYAIYTAGIIAAFHMIGITWSHVQWLVAALSLGLGFGLQEIFANFVSGLIILIERPIRKGDTVTVGGVMGTVTRIRARATTILDWDRKELIIPNKSFITGELINWSLSDEILRVTIKVGIAYGSDTAEAQKQLLKVAAESKRVLKDPPPQALFLGFGDSSLNFELRVFIAGINDFLPVQNEMHMEIDAAFRKAGIVIAFPQRDLHIISMPERLSVQETQ